MSTPAPYLDALFSLAGRRALVTGGSSGIGWAIAETLGRAGADPTRTEATARRTMTGRNGELSDFAGAAVLLAGPSAAFVTGQTVFVDGGFSVT